MDDLYGKSYQRQSTQKDTNGSAYTNSNHFGEQLQHSNSANSHLFPRDILEQPQPFSRQTNSQPRYSQRISDDPDSGAPQFHETSRQLPAQGSRGRISIQSGSTYSTQAHTNPPFDRKNVEIYQQQRPTLKFSSHSIDHSDHNQKTTKPSKDSGMGFYGKGDLGNAQPQTPPPISRLKLQSFHYQPSKPMAQSSSPLPLVSSPSRRNSQRQNFPRPHIASRHPPDPFRHADDKSFSQVSKAPLGVDISDKLTKSQAAYDVPKLSSSQQPPVLHGIQLVSTRELSDRFQQVFPYGIFNAVQSKCFESVYKTNDNLIVSAPTGSGKTVILELAICKLVEELQSRQFKIVYQAPTKSLCAERVRDWQKKFAHLGLNCAELTGDTESSEMRNVGEAAIIITTPEKWDSVTRKWKDHMRLLQMVKLFLIDEVHILKDIRGATLEAVISRMKTIGANVRFVALSATIPNSQDIATWLGKDHNNDDIPAHRETFGEDFRPVKLQKWVHGFENRGNNAFSFDKYLDGKICNLILKYTAKKSIMVFCFTRKSCEVTAAALATWWAASKISERAWPAASPITVAHEGLQKLVQCGVAFHHAGLVADDRAAIESAYLGGQISVICCTSTLAVGVNLPCHMVVLKNTVGYQDGGQLKEYSDLEVMQMLGRAGRPQFDTTAAAIIMTTNDKVDRYRRMISGQDILESTLHINLIEHLNSEIGLGTVKDMHSAKRWLAGTFLAVRLKQNPTYYNFEGVTSNTRNADERLEMVCDRGINLLQDAKLITGDAQFSCTEYGVAMARYMVPFKTMKALLSVPEHAKIGQMLPVLCQVPEFAAFRMKQNERGVLRTFNECGLLKFPIKENISTTAHKVSLMIQVQLSGVQQPNDKTFNMIRIQFQLEQKTIMERMRRLIMCLIDCKSYDCDGTSTRNALELMRSITAGYWENSPLQLQQIPNLGPVACRKFIGADISSIEKLMKTSSQNIERIMTKNPPYGQSILTKLKEFPQLRIAGKVMPWKAAKSKDCLQVSVQVRLSLSSTNAPFWQGKAPTVTFTAETTNGLLVSFWRGSIRKLEEAVDLRFMANLLRPGDEVTCYLACDEIVGTLKGLVLAPDIPAAAFPESRTTLPLSIADPFPDKKNAPDEFGSDDIDDQDIIAVASKAETSTPDELVNDGFVDVDTFDVPSDQDERAIDDDAPFNPVQLPCGKWQCKHACSSGIKKRDKPCKHRCCHEGLEKPPKPPVKSRKKPQGQENISTQGRNSKEELGPSRKKPNRMEQDQHYDSDNELEVINIGNFKPQPKNKDSTSYGPKTSPKIPGNLHKEIYNRITPKNSIYSFGATEQPDLPYFLHETHKQPFSGIAPEALLKNNDPFSDDYDDYLPSVEDISKQNSADVFVRPNFLNQHNPEDHDSHYSQELDDALANFDFDVNQPSQGVADQQNSGPSGNFENFMPRSLSERDIEDEEYDTTSHDMELGEVSNGAKRSAEDRLDVNQPTKVRRVTGKTDLNKSQMQGEGSMEKAVPEWVKDFDPTLLEFFDGLAEYV